MKKFKRPSKFTIPILGLSMLFLFALCDNPQSPDTDTPDIETVDAVSPTNSSSQGLPARPRPTTAQTFGPINGNFSFHEVIWEYFTWLISDSGEDGKLVFETLYHADEIGPNMRKSGDLFLDQGQKASKGALIGGVEQAHSHSILVDKNGRAVYTSIHIDDIYHKFIMDNKLYDPAVFQKFDKNANFPKGAISLKVSWKIVGEGDDTSKFYTTTAKLAKLGKNSDGEIIVTDEMIEERVAMVGFHLALVVKDHPEFIWGTFEHDDNAPDWPSKVTSNKFPVSDKNYTFYDAGTTTKEVNRNNTDLLSLDVASQKLSPVTQVARAFPYGTMQDTSFNHVLNIKNIKKLNKQNKTGILKNTVWENYGELGATWFGSENALKPDNTYTSDSGAVSIITGSTALSNSVIETFTQRNLQRNQCFSCHNTFQIAMPNPKDNVPGKNLNTSHILVTNYKSKVNSQ